MVNFKVSIPLVLTLFVWQGIAEAASMSTRVRILESKVAKQDRIIKQSSKLQKMQSSKVNDSLAQIKTLEKKVDKLLKSSEVAKKTPVSDKRYAFP